jgi:ATP-dependent Clp protease ATP-binding subunit ClpC
VSGDSPYWARTIRPKRDLAYVSFPARERVVAEVERALRGEPGSAAIVGPAGVGKGVAAKEVARRFAADGWMSFAASAGEAIAGLKYIGEIEERLQEIARKDGRVLWLLPDLVPALTAGTYTENPHGLVDRLMPLLEHGRVRLLAPCEPAEWGYALHVRPALGALVAPIRLEPASDEDTMRLAAVRLEEAGVRLAPEELREAGELAREHLPAIAAPGHLLRLLATAVRRRMKLDAPVQELSRDDLIPALAELTGLPEDLLDGRRALDLEAVERFFGEHVLGQPEAVRVLVERIALIKAGLTDPTRPLGVFLFTGPTGTGKTELAKTLARYLFGSPERLLRADMSEMQTPADVQRLIGGADVGPATA